MTRFLLILLFTSILAAMVAMTVYAALDRSVFHLRPELTSDPWFHATLADTYFGFMTFYVWVAYRESNGLGRVVWFVLIMTLGNIAMSIYVLIRLWRWEPQLGASALLLRDRPSQTASSYHAYD
jgi:hypothetical protein